MSGFVNPSAPPPPGGSDLPYPTHPPTQGGYPSPGGYPPAPYGQSPYPPAPSQSPYPPPQQAYPPQQDSYPPPSYGSNIPYPGAPPAGYPPNDVPYPPSNNPSYHPSNTPYPYPANNAPYPQSQPSYPQNNSPYPPSSGASYPPPSPDSEYEYHQERSGHSNMKAGALGAAGAAGAALLSGVKSLAGGKKHPHDGGGYGGHPHQEYYDDRGHYHNKGQKSDKMDNVLHMGQQVMQSGLLGRKAQMAGAAMHVANTDTNTKSGGLLGTAAASGLLGHKGRMAAHATGLGGSKGSGGVTGSRVLGSGLLGNKGVAAAMAMDLVKGRKH